MDIRVDQQIKSKEYANKINCLGIYVGAPDMIRTRDPLITNQVLYQLSYKGSCGGNSTRFWRGKLLFGGVV